MADSTVTEPGRMEQWVNVHRFTNTAFAPVHLVNADTLMEAAREQDALVQELVERLSSTAATVHYFDHGGDISFGECQRDMCVMQKRLLRRARQEGA